MNDTTVMWILTICLMLMGAIALFYYMDYHNCADQYKEVVEIIEKDNCICFE